MNEKRETHRLELKTKHLDAISFGIKDRVINISYGGCKVLTTDEYNESDDYELQVFYDDDIFTIHGEILRNESDDHGFRTYAILFDHDINKNELEVIDDFIETYILKKH